MAGLIGFEVASTWISFTGRSPALEAAAVIVFSAAGLLVASDADSVFFSEATDVDSLFVVVTFFSDPASYLMQQDRP